MLFVCVLGYSVVNVDLCAVFVCVRSARDALTIPYWGIIFTRTTIKKQKVVFKKVWHVITTLEHY